jgi:molybdate transport system substrate-binding protein
VKVRIHYASGLGIRQSIAGMQNTGRFFIETGPYHLVAPANPELIDRLEMKYYVLPGTRRPYATVPLVLVVPESVADAPSSFEAFARDPALRLAVADPDVTELGLRTQSFLKAMGLSDVLAGRLYVAHDARGVLDHLLNGEADAGILFGSDAARERSRVRVVANSAEEFHRSIVYYMAMERYCPNRKLCQEFLDFIGSPEAQKILLSLGYGAPRSK